MVFRFPSRAAARILTCLLIIVAAQTAFAQQNVVIQWNNAAIQTIRYRRPWPTINARVLAITHTCMYDAWAAYDERAQATILGGKLRRPPAERTEQNKNTAISFAAYRCLSDLFPKDVAAYDALMSGFGLNPSNTSRDPKTPIGIGNLAAESVLQFRHHDGSNQLGDLHPEAYTDYTQYKPVNSVDKLEDADHWQPLRTPVPDGGLYGRFLVQSFTTPQWAFVTPFAMRSGSEFRPQAPASYTRSRDRYVRQAREILELSANLTDDQKMMVEYWADGPNSETPPGHWCLFAQFVSARDHHGLDDDVKMFFALTNALLDASIAAWDAKLAYDSVRPITAIHLLFAGQKVQAWGGRFKGTQTIRGDQWQPYQPQVMAMTPAFPEFISGHSTFSAAAAEVLKEFTGSDAFGASYSFQRGKSKFEYGMTPRSDLTLSWPTFTAAAEQAGMSRRYCGIHFADGDLYGRETGRKVGRLAWRKAQDLINGKVSDLATKTLNGNAKSRASERCADQRLAGCEKGPANLQNLF
jgi:hypothetical protein